MKKIFLIPMLCLLASCAGTNKATSSGANSTMEQGSSEPKPEPTVATDPTSEKDAKQNKSQKGQPDLYSVVVSFYSKGEGIDEKAFAVYNTFLDGFEKQHNINLNYVRTPWGREGEVDYCIQLNNMDSGKQSNFLMQTKEILFQSQLVHILENAPCKHMQ